MTYMKDFNNLSFLFYSFYGTLLTNIPVVFIFSSAHNEITYAAHNYG